MGFHAVLNPPQFTLEAWVFPQFDGDPLGNFYCLCETGAPSTGKQKTEGFGLYAGPEDPTDPTSPYEWQIWMGDGTNFTKVANTLPSPAAVGFQLSVCNKIKITFIDTWPNALSSLEIWCSSSLDEKRACGD